MKALALAALALGLSMGAAHAADLIIPSAPMVDVASYSQDWNGFYAGVVGGYGSGTTSYQAVAGGAPVNVGISGWLLGVTAGYNHQWNQFVLGVEGDIAWSNIGGSAAAGGGNTINSTVSWMGTLRGRAGVTFDQALIYVTAGLAAAGVNSSVTPLGTSFASTHTGWTAGAGVEYAVTDDWSVKGEYTYTALSTVNDGGALAGGVPANAINIAPSFHTVKVGANFHF